MIRIAILGRPNVGKSSLFNRLIGKKHALVDDRPGVTRDRREGIGRLFGFEFILIDTAGLENAKDGSLSQRMMEQTEYAADEADICFMMVDGRAGLTSEDKFFAKWLRKKGKKTFVLVNKCEGSKGDAGYYDALQLGFKAIAISAEHGVGMDEIYELISEYDVEEEIDVENNKSIQISIVGRPNTGKSTLVNALIGSNRVLTGPEAGITRDSIAIKWQFGDLPIKLVDTAGIRRKAKIKEKLEHLSVVDSRRSIQYANVVILMLDVNEVLTQQDIDVARLVINEGRAIIIGVNKWDLVKHNQNDIVDAIRERAEYVLPELMDIPIVQISALKNKNIDVLIEEAIGAYKVWNKKITTAKLNNWLHDVQARHLPPLANNKRRIRFKYISQIKTRPPSFNVFCNKPEDLPDSYKRYMVSSLRKAFGLPGVPIRFDIKKSANPYADKS